MSLDIFLRYLIMVGIVIGLGVWIYFCHKNPQLKNYAVSPILFCVHALLFTVIAAFNLIPKEIYLIWGDLVSIHGVIILISTGIVLIQHTGGKNNG